MKPVHTEYSKQQGGHYVPGMEYNGVLYISGQLSKDPQTGMVPSGGIKAEAEQALANLELVLKARSLVREDVIFCRVYTPDVVYWDEINDVYAKFFGEHKPARAIVPTNPLHFGCLIEIEAMAAIKEVE
ncbi:RidA family protein [Oceanobacillus sp. FSL K6-2867]|uniref:RidA family protein n=1 Tax=Oceanobacillus sp. FSL K6-2867 TaxID=2954748 RepID=UPI0030DCEFC5